MISRRRLADLTTAAEHYERLVQAGELRGGAFASAMRVLGQSRPVVIVPVELPDVIDRIVRSQVAGDHRRLVTQLRSGEDNQYGSLRTVLYYVLTRFGYHPSHIGAALKRDRSTVLKTVQAFSKRLESNDLLRARVEAIVTAGAERRVA